MHPGLPGIEGYETAHMQCISKRTSLTHSYCIRPEHPGGSGDNTVPPFLQGSPSQQQRWLRSDDLVGSYLRDTGTSFIVIQQGGSQMAVISDDTWMRAEFPRSIELPAQHELLRDSCGGQLEWLLDVQHRPMSDIKRGTVVVRSRLVEGGGRRYYQYRGIAFSVFVCYISSRVTNFLIHHTKTKCDRM